jgi:propanol-preferring alcohol dehydrogenase
MTRGAGHRALAERLGATWVGASDAPPPVPLDAAILFAPVGTLVPPALAALDRGGRLAVAGIHLTDIPALDYQRHLFQERELVSVTANTRDDGRALLALAASIPLRCTTQPFSLADANEALRRLRADQIDGAAVLHVGADRA